MTKSILRVGILACALLSAAAWAVGKGGTLYIKSKDTKLLDKAAANGKSLATLKAGEAVVWQGADAKEKMFHKIDVGGKSGYVLQANLSPNKPAQEFVGSDGKPMSPQAFASSGAATKALTETGAKYAASKGSAEVAAELIYIEEHNKNKATDQAVAEHAKKSGLAAQGGK